MTKSIRKRIATVTAAIVMAVSTMAVNVSAKSINDSVHCDSKTIYFNSYTTTYTGSYSYLYSAPGYTQVSAINSDYYKSYKYAEYTEYSESNNTYTKYYTESAHTTEIALVSGTKRSVSSVAAMRAHIGYVCLTSSSSSSKVDQYYTYVYKK